MDLLGSGYAIRIENGKKSPGTLLGAALAEWQRRREEEEARKRAAAAAAQQEKKAAQKAEQARLAYLNAAYQAKLDREKAAQIAALEAKSACPKADELPPAPKPAFDLAR